MIDRFSGDYRFLSNFWPVPVEFEGVVYPSTEHAFQAAKTLDVAVRRDIAGTKKPGEAKQLGRALALRPDWEQVKLDVMEEVLRCKFAPGTALAEKLAATGAQDLIEGNTWDDCFWGICRGQGTNHLGRLLMKIRAELSTYVEGMSPPLKWAGSKRWALSRLRELYAAFRHYRLVEPFVGGMNVALGLLPERALLTDVNLHLINFYVRLRKERPFTIAMENDRAFYERHREIFNALITMPSGKFSDDAAELFYYLNRNGFNGLCRFNNSGLFNVPFGKYKTVTFRRDFSEYAPLVQRWVLGCGDFDAFNWQPDDFVFADPPYDGTFVDYSSGGFDWDAQVRLARRLAAHSGPSVATNAATERVLTLYRDLGFSVETLNAPRTISSNGDREAASEMLATRNL